MVQIYSLHESRNGSEYEKRHRTPSVEKMGFLPINSEDLMLLTTEQIAEIEDNMQTRNKPFAGTEEGFVHRNFLDIRNSYF